MCKMLQNNLRLHLKVLLSCFDYIEIKCKHDNAQYGTELGRRFLSDAKSLLTIVLRTKLS